MRLIHSNIRSFRTNIDKLLDVLEIFDPDIFGINETHFDHETTFEKFETSSLNFKNKKHILRAHHYFDKNL